MVVQPTASSSSPSPSSPTTTPRKMSSSQKETAYLTMGSILPLASTILLPTKNSFKPPHRPNLRRALTHSIVALRSLSRGRLATSLNSRIIRSSPTTKIITTSRFRMHRGSSLKGRPPTTTSSKASRSCQRKNPPAKAARLRT